MLNDADAAKRFREVVVPYLSDALGLARWLTGNRPDAEDVVQEACLRAFKAIGSYSGGSAKAWVLAIVRNTCFTWLAKNRPKSLVLTSEPDVFEAGAGLADFSQQSPEAALIAAADEREIEQAIAGLPHLSREILVLRDVSGMSYREISNMLAIPMGTVMSRLAKARALLMRSLGKVK